MKHIRVAILIVLMTLVMCGETVNTEASADRIFINGRIWTVDPQNPWAEAVAVKKGMIMAVGNKEDMPDSSSGKIEVVDLEGAFVLPGFIDGHVHFLEGGFALDSIELRKAKSKEAFIRMIGERATTMEKGQWILNGNWDHQQFDPPLLPRKEWIDPVTQEIPVCVNRHDGHMVLLNSLALEMAGISSATPDPSGGEIVRDPQTGEPTGILIDAAMGLAEEKIPSPSPDEQEKACRAALALARSNGITSVHDMAYSSRFEVYRRLLERGELTARVRVYIQIPSVDGYDTERFKQWEAHEYLSFGGLKGFADGSLGSSSALFFEPYSDDPDSRGLFHEHLIPEEIMKQRLTKAEELGLQVAIHAIGDRANHIVLDLYEEIISSASQRDRRWRIEHAQHLHPDDIPRFGQLGVLASIQPYHAIDDGRWAEKKIGRERARYAYAFRSLLENGAVLVCGSDWTVAPLDPIQGIYAAVTRRTLDGKNPEGWIPEEKITLEEAIKGYTLNAAYAEFSEHIKGSIETGKKADMVVLDRNLFEIPPSQIAGAVVLMTVLDGRIVFQR